MRVGILCLMQESNTFLNRKTEFHHFEEDLFLEGNEIGEKMVDSHHEVPPGIRRGARPDQ